MRQCADGLNVYEALRSDAIQSVDPWGLNAVVAPIGGGDPYPSIGPWDGVDLGWYISRRCKCKCGLIDKAVLWKTHQEITNQASERATGVFPTADLRRAFRHCLASGEISGLVGCDCTACVGTAREEWQSGRGEQTMAWHFIAEIGNLLGRRCAGCRGPNADRDPYAWRTVMYCHEPMSVHLPTRPTVDRDTLFDCCKAAITENARVIQSLADMENWF